MEFHGYYIPHVQGLSHTCIKDLISEAIINIFPSISTQVLNKLCCDIQHGFLRGISHTGSDILKEVPSLNSVISDAIITKLTSLLEKHLNISRLNSLDLSILSQTWNHKNLKRDIYNIVLNLQVFEDVRNQFSKRSQVICW